MDTRRILWILTTIVHSKRALKRWHTRGQFPVLVYIWATGESLKGYFAAITAMDLNVGRILEKLEGLGLREDTLVVFSSDNGYSCGHHGFWHKGNGTFPLNMYENSVKVPFIMSHPAGIPQGHVTPAMASQYDFMPTLLDYLGLEMPADPLRPGRSFRPALLGETDDVQDEVVIFDEYGPCPDDSDAGVEVCAPLPLRSP